MKANATPRAAIASTETPGIWPSGVWLAENLRDDRNYAPPATFKPHATSNSPAAPMPPPMHIVTTTYFTPRRFPSIRAWPTSREPLIP